MKFTTKFQLQIISPNYSSLNYVILFLFYMLTQNKMFNFLIYQTNFPLKIKKFTVLKSPHIFKTARTQLELRSLKKTIVISNFDTNVTIQIFEKILHKMVKNLAVAVKLKIKFFKIMYI